MGYNYTAADLIGNLKSFFLSLNVPCMSGRTHELNCGLIVSFERFYGLSSAVTIVCTTKELDVVLCLDIQA